MSDQRLPNESWESFAERKIQEAQEQGQFDNLPGFGRPIPGIDEPLDENWWIRRKLRAENLSVLPPILQVRLEAEKTLEAIHRLTSEREVRRRLTDLNEKIREAHYSPLPGPPLAVNPIDIEATVAEWKLRRAEPTRR